MFSSSWLQAWLGARVPVIYYWSTATKSLCFHCFDKITLLDPDTGWFHLFFSLDKNALQKEAVILDTLLLSLNLEIFFTSTLLQRKKIYLMCDSCLSIKLCLARAIYYFIVEYWTQLDILGVSHTVAPLLLNCFGHQPRCLNQQFNEVKISLTRT